MAGFEVSTEGMMLSMLDTSVGAPSDERLHCRDDLRPAHPPQHMHQRRADGKSRTAATAPRWGTISRRR